MSGATTYVGRNVAKQVGSFFISGSGDAASGIAADAKADVLEEIIQRFNSGQSVEYNDQTIGETDVLLAIAYVRGKKRTKARRKAVISATKFGLQIAATCGGATIGSVVPIAGTALGAVGGAVAGASLGVGVTAADHAKRKLKGFYKILRGTRGEHRKQAAQCLMHCATHHLGWRQEAANMACSVILGEEYDAVMRNHDVTRLADRMKSN